MAHGGSLCLSNSFSFLLLRIAGGLAGDDKTVGPFLFVLLKINGTDILADFTRCGMSVPISIML